MSKKRKHKYRVVAEMTISVSTVVEATSEKEAIEIAQDRYPESLDTQGDDTVEWCTSGELDGTPKNFTVEEDE